MSVWPINHENKAQPTQISNALLTCLTIFLIIPQSPPLKKFESSHFDHFWEGLFKEKKTTKTDDSEWGCHYECKHLLLKLEERATWKWPNNNSGWQFITWATPAYPAHLYSIFQDWQDPFSTYFDREKFSKTNLAHNCVFYFYFL